MANSIIDDMFKEQLPNDKSKKKKSTKIFIFLIILLIIVIIVAAIAIIYLKKKNEITPKMAFLEYLGKTNLTTVLDFGTYNELSEKMKSENSQTSADLEFSLSSALFSIDDVKLSLNSDSDVQNEKSYSTLGLNYLNTDIINLEMLTSKDSIGIKSDDIVIKYIGSKYENLGKVISNITSEDFVYKDELSSLDASSLVNMQVSIPTIPAEVIDKYIEVIEKNVDDISFSSKPVTLDRDSGAISTTEYAMAINEEAMQKILIQMLQTLETDDELLNIFVSSFESYEITEDDIKTQIDNKINELYDEEVDSFRIYTIKVYAYNNLTAKLYINIAGETTIDVDYEYGDTENSAKITILDVESQDAIEVTLTKTVSDVSEKLTTVIDAVEASEIIGELTIDSTIFNNQTSYEIKNKINLKYMGMNASLDIDSKINFKEVTVEDLTEENCLYLDTLNNDTLTDVVEAISERTEEVITDRISSLSENDNNSYSTIIEQPNDSDLEGESAITKDEAKQKLYDSVVNAMSEAINNGDTYTISDLKELEIPDSTFSISVNDDIAIVIVDGYEFTIDSDFNLSD